MEKNKDEELDFLAPEENESINEKKLSVNSADDIFAESGHIFADDNLQEKFEEKNQGKRKVDFYTSNYPDKKNLRRMNFGLWLSESRGSINRFFIIFLSVLSLGFFVFSVISLVNYIKAGDPTIQMVENNLTFKSNVKQLVFSQVNVFPGSDKIDLAILVKNENPNFYVSFDYCFNQGDKAVSCGQNFILPSEEKYVIAFSVKPLDQPGDYSFVISKMSWSRISKSIANYEDYYKQRLGVLIEDVSFNSSLKKASSYSDTNNLDFTLLNPTAFSYFELPLNILVFSGTELSGVNRHTVDSFYSGESRQINLSWTAPLGTANRVEIKPSLNIFDDNVFIKYGGN